MVGDITEAELKPMLEARLGAWKNKTVPMKNVSPVKIPSAQSVYIIDKPGAMQSIIFAAQLTPSATDPGFEAIKIMNAILGGEFTSRINMNLREDKHWSYGSFTFMPETVGQGFITAYAPVQTDKTKESVIELQKEINAYVGDKQATEAEFKKRKPMRYCGCPESGKPMEPSWVPCKAPASSTGVKLTWINMPTCCVAFH